MKIAYHVFRKKENYSLVPRGTLPGHQGYEPVAVIMVILILKLHHVFGFSLLFIVVQVLESIECLLKQETNPIVPSLVVMAAVNIV